ncbi:MAG: alpha/beta hydrolase [Phycisphaeraceae bacterium]|nr:alpha/beta hydrolase [Phycisphaeraceae bacterium]
MRTFVLVVAALTSSVFAQEAPSRPVAGSFKVTLDAALQDTPYTGRIYVTLTKREGLEPRRGMGAWFAKNPVFAVDAVDVAPGGTVAVDAAAMSFPAPMKDIEAGDYTAQAVARRSVDSPFPGFGPGDLYSDPVPLTFTPGDSSVVEFKLANVVKEEPFRETDRIKEVSFVSPLLSAFYGRQVKARAAVILPKNWKDVPGTRHPTIYFIGGFGSSHTFAHSLLGRLPASADEVMVVIPDPLGPLGHSVFADSENNGPRGRSLIEELIPAVESRFHGPISSDIRWVTGISSGGWSSLWLAITYPDMWGNCWSFCPDPVDFRDFQRIDLYAPDANMYTDPAGNRRPLARQGTEAAIWYEDFCKQEWVLGHGGQIHSFEAVFSPREDGKPRPLFNRDTGAVDPETARHWQKYDIRLIMEQNWPTLGPKVDGKIHVYAGELDSFYLESSTRRLAESLKALGSTIDVHILPGMGHTIPQVPWKVMFQILRDRAAGQTNLPSVQPR